MRLVGLYLAAGTHSGGAFQYSMSMLEAVAALPHDRYISTVVYSHVGWRDIVAQFDLNAIHIPTPFTSNILAYAWRKMGLPIRGWRKLAPIFDPLTQKLLHLGCQLWIYPSQDPMAYLLPVPALTTVHDLMHRYERRFPEVSGFRMRELHYLAACRYAKGLLVDSEIGKLHLMDSYGVAPSLIHILSYVPPRYMYATLDSPCFEKRYRLPEKFLFYPAQFWEHKNHHALLRAVDALATKLPDICFVFVGACKNGYGQLIRVVKKLGLSDRVQILDYVPSEDMPSLYRRARAMIMPTFFGPTNIPPLEAMVVGCPMAVSRIYAMEDLCGDSAIYFNPTSDQEIADAIARLWTDDALCAELSSRGRERAKLFSQDKFNHCLLSLVDEMWNKI